MIFLREKMMRFRLSTMSYRARLLWGLLIVNIPMFIILSTEEIVAVRNFAFQREINAITTEGKFLAADVTDALLDHDRARLQEILSFATALAASSQESAQTIHLEAWVQTMSISEASPSRHQRSQ